MAKEGTQLMEDVAAITAFQQHTNALDHSEVLRQDQKAIVIIILAMGACIGLSLY